MDSIHFGLWDLFQAVCWRGKKNEHLFFVRFGLCRLCVDGDRTGPDSHRVQQIQVNPPPPTFPTNAPVLTVFYDGK
jgi:hypothetical protein